MPHNQQAHLHIDATSYGLSQADNADQPRANLLEIPFANISLESALKQVSNLTQGGTNKQASLFFVNAHCLNTTFDNDHYRQALKEADLIFPDGSGMRKGCEMHGDSLIENLNGTDLFPHLCRQFAATGQSVFFLGAAPGTAEKVAAWASRHYPTLTIAGTQHGFFSASETDAVIEKINNSKASILFVAMGVPRQELWIAQHRLQLNTALNIAVGGLFEFFGDNIPRAPLWMRNSGVEWIWRLIQEPGRMWQRYLVGNPLFLLRLRREISTQKFVALFPQQLGEKSQHLRLSLSAIKQRAGWRWSHLFHYRAKRLLDITVASLALICLSPLFALLALTIRADSPGPVFFRQIRAGYRARPFMLWKFRSMYSDAEARRAELESRNEMSGGVLFKIKDDPRITPVGRIIRKLSLDELPQLWNVLKGDMSLVGPRPALHSEVKHYSLEQRQRLDTRPGLTSDWVIAGRSTVPFDQQASMDIDYVHRHSLWRDIKLLVKTIPALISGRGAS